MWTLLFACAAPPAPAPAPEPPAAPVAPPAWRLTGRASSAGLDTPSLPGGAARLGESCAALNEQLGGDGPPCFVEEWTSDRVLSVERAGQALRFDGRKGRTRWTQIRGPLAGCLGDPLALPPAGDPGGTRALEDGRWVLSFQGANRCELGGTLILDATRDQATWSGVTVAGLPWDGGGRDRALAVVRADLRALVRDRWRELGPAEREDALRALADDPDPEAARLLRLRRR